MAKANKTHPQHSKPYDQKVAQRQSARRAMRTGGEGNVPHGIRPDMPEGSPNPQEQSRVSGGPETESAAEN